MHALAVQTQDQKLRVDDGRTDDWDVYVSPLFRLEGGAAAAACRREKERKRERESSEGVFHVLYRRGVLEDPLCCLRKGLRTYARKWEVDGPLGDHGC